MSIHTESCDLNEIMLGDSGVRSNAFWQCGEVGHFHKDCHKSNTQTKTRDNIGTVIDEMTYTLTANSPVTIWYLNSYSKNK